MARRDRAPFEPDHLLAGAAPHRLDAQKKSFLFAERDAVKRAEFEHQLSQIAPCDRVYVDEAGVEDTLSYPWGWSPRGTRALAQKLGHHTQRISMAAGWCCGEIISPLTFEGYCDAALIEAWFQQQFCRALRSGQTVILDNASFHRKAQLTALLESVGCFLLFVPPYSPDLNKIEPLWNALKHKIMLDKRQHPDFRTKVDAAFV